MFLTPKDLNGAAGPNGLNGFAGRKRSRVKLVKPRKIAMRPSRVPLRTTSMRGLGAAPAPKTKAEAAALVRQVVDPARAKKIMDATILRVQAENAAKAVKIRAYLDRRAGLGYLSYSWYNPVDRLRGKPMSDLEKYTEEERQLIYKYLRNSDPKVLEYQFTQENLDASLKNAKTGETLPAGTPTLQDPTDAAVQEFVQGVKDDVVNASATVANAAVAAAETVGEGVAVLYEKGKEVVGMPFRWLSSIKWYLFAGLGVVGVVIALPYIQAARAPGLALKKSLSR